MSLPFEHEVFNTELAILTEYTGKVLRPFTRQEVLAIYTIAQQIFEEDVQQIQGKGWNDLDDSLRLEFVRTAYFHLYNRKIMVYPEDKQ